MKRHTSTHIITGRACPTAAGSTAAFILAWLALTGLALNARAQFTPPNGYLPASGFNTSASTNNVYQPNSQYTISSNNPANPTVVGYNAPVQCPAQNIGNINLDYGIWIGSSTSGGVNNVGGAAISGQFTADPSFTLPANTVMGWAQCVDASVVGQSGTVWGAGSGVNYADTLGSLSNPAYPFLTLANGGPTPAQPSVAMQDFPSRSFNGQNNQFWIGELGLCELNYTNHTAIVLGTVIWGFVENGTNSIDVYPTARGFLTGSPITDFLNTENSDFNSANHAGATDWTFSAYVCPAPESSVSSLLVLGFGVVGAARRWRRTGVS